MVTNIMTQTFQLVVSFCFHKIKIQKILIHRPKENLHRFQHLREKKQHRSPTLHPGLWTGEINIFVLDVDDLSVKHGRMAYPQKGQKKKKLADRPQE